MDIFLKEAIYSQQDQDTIMRLWLGYGEADGQRRGEELLFFLDAEDISAPVYRKFAAFHLSAADQTQHGEIEFAEFVRMYQLLAVQYQAPDSILGAYVCAPRHRPRRAPVSPQTPSSNEPPPPTPRSQEPVETEEEAREWRRMRASVLERLEYSVGEEGTQLFAQDAPLTHIYFVFAGKIQTYRTTRDGQKQVIGTVGAGAYVGAIEYITRGPLLVSGVALQRTFVVKLPVDGFEYILKRSTDLVWTMISTSLMNIRNIQTLLQSEALRCVPSLISLH